MSEDTTLSGVELDVELAGERLQESYERACLFFHMQEWWRQSPHELPPTVTVRISALQDIIEWRYGDTPGDD